MAKQTIQEQLAAALEKRGYRKATARSRKYLTYVKSDEPTRFIFLGKAGALRVGPTASDSIPNERFKRELLAEVSNG